LTSFNDFGLAEPLLRALAEEDYQTPTPIQAQTIPVVMTHRDVVGIAQTGTGKTAAFALPILHHLNDKRRPPVRKSCRVLVLSPTRELSSQIETSFKAYGRHVRVATALAIGGVPMGRQVRTLMNGVDVLVATPGRLLDLVKSNALKLDDVEVLVLDEADRMLDMGFIHDIRKIVAKLPKARQTLFFSATMPRAIAELAEHMLSNPAQVAVTPVASTAERIDQRVVHVDRAAKPTVLADLLSNEPGIGRVLVFTRTKHGADKVVRGLERAGLEAAAIHGNKSQGQRERALASFRTGSVRTLVATDIAARGIDVDGITHVINYDLPNIPETYVHRIGRTARAGADGIAISLCDREETAYLRDIEKLIRMSIPASDRRQSPRPARRDEAESRAPGKQARGRDHDEGSARGERQARPHGGRPNRRNNAKRADAQPQGQQPQAQRPRSQPPKAQQSKGRHSQAPRSEQPQRPDARPQHRNDRPQPAQPRRDHHPHPRNDDAGIAAVAFMQRRSRPERGSDRRAPR
jgi:ATP-dependent RNA helicase RhlE